MNRIALVTDAASFSIDFDMPLLIDACKLYKLAPDIVKWDDPTVKWNKFNAILIRSPWSYTERLKEFLVWCEHVKNVSILLNPIEIVRWGLDKHYLGDLAKLGVPIVPTQYLYASENINNMLKKFNTKMQAYKEIVIKPTVGAYSRDVKRFSSAQIKAAEEHIFKLFAKGDTVMLQPYLNSIDTTGETNIIYFGGEYSHAICKDPLLAVDGTVKVPSTETRSSRVADTNELRVAGAAMSSTAKHLGLERSILYARIDLIRDINGNPVVLEMETAEPSLSLSFAAGSAGRFAKAISNELKLFS